MKKGWGLVLIFTLLSVSGWTQAVNKKILILPLDKSKISGWNSAQVDNTSQMIIDSIYSFIGLLPFVDVPQLAELKKIKTTDIPALARSQNADLIFYGDLNFTGDKDAPQAEITLKIWSKEKNTDIFTKKYITATDLDIFDAVDRMTIDAIASAFLITPRFAVMNFSGFEILDEKYSLYVNNKLIDKVKNSGFNKSLKILANNKYNIMMIRDRDNVIVFSQTYTLKEKSVATVSYKGAATVIIKPLKSKQKAMNYKILLDGEVVRENQEIKSLPLTMDHTLMVVSENDNRIVYKQVFKLTDGEIRNLTANLAGRKWYVRIYGIGNSFGGAGLDYFLNRELWLGLDLGYALAVNTTLNASVSVMTPYLDLGYYILGNKDYDMKLGLGLGVGMSYAFPPDQWSMVSTAPNMSILTRTYAQAEWKFFYIKAGILLDFYSGIHALPMVAVGMKF